MTTRRCANVLVGLKVPVWVVGRVWLVQQGMRASRPYPKVHSMGSQEVSRGGHPKCTDQGMAFPMAHGTYIWRHEVAKVEIYDERDDETWACASKSSKVGSWSKLPLLTWNCVTPRKPLGEGHWIRSGNRESNKYLSFLLSLCRGVLRLHVGARWDKHMTQIALMSA